MVETITSAFVDEFPDLLANRKVLFTAIMCFIEFLLGVPCVMQGGVYILQIMDWYCATFSLMLLCLAECIAIAWIYGVDRFYKDLELMIGYQPSVWWKICWCFISPTMITFIWLFSVLNFSAVTYGDYEYPDWGIALGWMFGLASLVPIPLCAIISILKEQGPITSRIHKLCQPTEDFGPAVPEYREKYLASLDTRHSYLPTLRNRRPPSKLSMTELQTSPESQIFITSS
ncbi:Sodium- and chloride-dependent glycine transporter 2 [Mizuhopecten yessoensis]|uniref:Sodium-and chloride-dependent glycine transporter 2 n=2 Tax=Mizuhopecten yessoensis TaxID=6573 RepID=A0A210QAD4_MIZYE|nr:Sodium- and chloride-dependent glycine transporter 2 [Mizuhopecten yessoensis]